MSAEYPSCYLTSSSFLQAIVRDFSLNGFRIEGHSHLLCDAVIMVRLWLPNQEASLDIDQAVVRWVRGREFGVQIVTLSNEVDLRLARHVEQTLQHEAIRVTNTVKC